METEARVVSITNKQVAVLVTDGELENKLYGLPPDPGAIFELDQLVIIDIHTSGYRADWVKSP